MRPRRRTLLSLLSACTLATVGLVALGASPASALTQITVTNNSDALVAGSLRQAFADAQAGNDDFEITIPASVGNITLVNGSLTYAGGVGGTHSLTLLGGGNTITQTTANDRVMNIPGGTTFTVNNLTITGGVAPAGQVGGGIRSSGGSSVVVTNSTITGNSAPTDGGGIHTGGTLTLTNSTLSGNTATTGAGGGANSGGNATVTNSTVSGNDAPAAQGGGLVVNGNASVTSSTISGNDANEVGGIRAGNNLTMTNSTLSGNTSTAGTSGGAFVGGTSTITGSTISGNTANGQGGGMLTNGAATFTNSTITGNTGSQGGGVYAQGALNLVYVTVVSNTASTGGNLELTSTVLTSFGSVVALPLGSSSNCNGQVSTTSNGYNWDDDGTCLFTGTGDNSNAGNPGLGALGPNGGPTQTMLPQTGSGLIDKIPATSPCAGVNITVDQRGLPRPTTLGQFCDIGATEVQPPAADPLVARFAG